VAGLLATRGYGQSRLTVLGGLGGPDEEVRSGAAATWSQPATALVITAVECLADRGTMPLPTTPGLPDGAYESDGKLTHAEVRAISLARLAAVPGQQLWDIGAGSGSIGIEWMRAHRSCRAVAVEVEEERAERIARNATRLGVPYLRVVRGRAPDVLARLPRPDAVFIGGGLATPLLVETCWEALPIGGRLVATADREETEAVLRGWFGRVGGELARVAVEHAEPGAEGPAWTGSEAVAIWSVNRW
jgi:precorrin-6Y C5,15-methyltransferase (decarboxylating)